MAATSQAQILVWTAAGRVSASCRLSGRPGSKPADQQSTMSARPLSAPPSAMVAWQFCLGPTPGLGAGVTAETQVPALHRQQQRVPAHGLIWHALPWATCPHRLVVRTSRCGSDNPGSNPGVDTWLKFFAKVLRNTCAMTNRVASSNSRQHNGMQCLFLTQQDPRSATPGHAAH